MKTTMKNTVAIIMLVLLPALTGVAQAGAVEYKNSYQRSVVGYQLSAVGYQGATVPSATFQSTSAYSEQWEQQENTLLNNDGSMNTSAYMTSGPRRAPGNGTGAGTPGGTLDPTTQQPLGDVLLPLMLLACAYAIYKVSRRRKEA